MYVVNVSGELVRDVEVFIGDVLYQCDEIQDGEVKEFTVKDRFVSSMAIRYDGRPLSSVSSELDDTGIVNPLTIIISRPDDPIFQEQ